MGQQKTPKQFLKTVTIISTFGGLLFGYDTGVVEAENEEAKCPTWFTFRV